MNLVQVDVWPHWRGVFLFFFVPCFHIPVEQSGGSILPVQIGWQTCISQLIGWHIIVVWHFCKSSRTEGSQLAPRRQRRCEWQKCPTGSTINLSQNTEEDCRKSAVGTHQGTVFFFFSSQHSKTLIFSEKKFDKMNHFGRRQSVM